MDMLFMFVCFTACSSVFLNIECDPDDGTWQDDLSPDLPYKRKELANGDESFHVKGCFVGFAQKNSSGIVTGLRMRVSGNLPGDYILAVGYALGWVSRDKAMELREAAKAIDFGLTCLVPNSWKSRHVKEEGNFRTEWVTEDLFKEKIDWLFMFKRRYEGENGSLSISGKSKVELDEVKERVVFLHTHSPIRFSEEPVGCSIQ
ncbi:hypothetical protein VCUG_02612 [Vavraia culicis subsp. floridensis]|uniref:Uncharacterized protein n=1 Tax=Vavraia culicis (isolate floridensis) TaxID=948595 RepID=L2GRB5_VAVCU|nr:uncharacterized protein VCUG_02612 [Vavraia culicis subsp. floridensis]ELA45897.1 hypothetical protein VCUG_02612 [Vavraia culicis subsp. floridensis]